MLGYAVVVDVITPRDTAIFNRLVQHFFFLLHRSNGAEKEETVV